MALIPAFLNRMFGRSTDATDDTVLLPSDPAPAVDPAPAAQDTTVHTTEAEQRRAAVLHNTGNPELKALLLESMAYDPDELLAFALHSFDEDAGRLVFTKVIASTWHASTAEGWLDRWHAALDAGLPPRTAFLAMQGAWIDRALVNGMTEAVLKSAAQSGMREDHIDFGPMWEAAKAMAVKHKLVEAVVRETFRRHVDAAAEVA
ncbi:hypothetical protein [Burkholderia anthina]|uniref:hypothetical protein n=1 Tax=Burkholderia anthina TaxID=179879 RepID=UPI0037BE3763